MTHSLTHSLPLVACASAAAPPPCAAGARRPHALPLGQLLLAGARREDGGIGARVAARLRHQRLEDVAIAAILGAVGERRAAEVGQVLRRLRQRPPAAARRPRRPPSRGRARRSRGARPRRARAGATPRATGRPRSARAARRRRGRRPSATGPSACGASAGARQCTAPWRGRAATARCGVRRVGRVGGDVGREAARVLGVKVDELRHALGHVVFAVKKAVTRGGELARVVLDELGHEDNVAGRG